MPTYSYRTIKRNRKRQITEQVGSGKVGKELTAIISRDNEIGGLATPDYWRPETYGDCQSMPRPCPYVGCRYNLWLESSSTGSLKVLENDIDHIPETCALDVAERGGVTLDEVGKMLGVSRERVRQLEHDALSKLAEKHPDLAGFFEDLMTQGGQIFVDSA